MYNTLARMGRNGDTQLAHITPAEARLLKSLGGAGTINPRTGLREYYQPEGGAGKASDTASGSKKSGIDKDRPGRSSGGNGGRSGGGARASGMSATAADHLAAMGRLGTSSIPGTGVATGNFPTQDEAYNSFARAVGQYANRGFMDRALDFLGGGFYNAQEPMAGNPRSFAGGTYHSASNPGSIFGGLAGMFMGPAGQLTGPLAGLAYNAAGLPQAWHGGYDQPDLRAGPFGNTNTQMGGTFGDVPGGGWFGGGNTYASGQGVNTASAGGMPPGSTVGNGGRIGPGHTVTPPGVLAPRPTAPGSPGAPGTPQPNPWGPPPPTPMPDFTNVPQWPGFNGPLAPPQNNNWGWG